MRSLFFLSIALFLGALLPALGALEDSLHQNTYIRAKKILEQTVDSTAKKKSKDWAQSLLALVYLQRLSGEEAEAKNNFFRCTKICMEQVNKDQWEELKGWACKTTTHTKTSVPKTCKW